MNCAAIGPPTGFGDIAFPSTSTTRLAPEEWDLMFRAVLACLTGVAVERAAPGATGRRLQQPGTVLAECLEALDQLRRDASLPTWPCASVGQSPVVRAASQAHGRSDRPDGAHAAGSAPSGGRRWSRGL